MARPLPNEAELYQKIRDENISVHPVVWDTMYHYLGDYISTINLIVSFFIEQNEPVSLEDARRILDYTNLIKEAVNKILHPERILDDDGRLKTIRQDDMALHPIIKEFFTHHIGNDTQMINFVTSFYLDPIDEQPVPVDDAKKILVQAVSMKEFLDKLREATLVKVQKSWHD